MSEIAEGQINVIRAGSGCRRKTLALGPYAPLYYGTGIAGRLGRIADDGLTSTLSYPATGSIVDVERYLGDDIVFLAAPVAGSSASAVGIVRGGASRATVSYAKIGDAVVTAPDGNTYIFEHAAASPAVELLAKVAVSR